MTEAIAIVPKAVKKRLSLRIDPELHRVLTERVGGQMTLNTLVEDACRRVYMPGGQEQAFETMHRSLIRMDARLRRSEVRSQVDLELLVLLFRTFLAATPELTPEEKPTAGASADARLARALDAVAETVGRSTSVLGRSQMLMDVLFPETTEKK